MKQISIIVVLLIVAYGVASFSNKEANVEDGTFSSGIEVEDSGIREAAISRDELMAQIGSLDENTKREVLEILGITE